MLPQRKDALVPNIPQALIQKYLEQGSENSFFLKYLQGQIFQMILIFIHQIFPKHLFFYIIPFGSMLMLLI